MTDLQIDLLKVLKYIDDNSTERMFPYIRTISSFINCNPYSTFIEIIKKYKDICSRKYSLGQRKIEEELTNLCSLGFVSKKSIKGHKVLYSLTSQGKLEVQNILSNANVEKSDESISDEAMKILRNKFAYLNEIQNTDFLGHNFLPFKKKEDEDYETMMLEVFKETNIYSYASCVLNKFELEIFNYAFALNYDYKQISEKFNYYFTKEQYDIFILKTIERILTKVDSIMEGYDAYMIDHIPHEQWDKLSRASSSLDDNECSNLFEKISKSDSDEMNKIDNAIIEKLLELISSFHIDKKAVIKLEDAALNYKDLKALEKIYDDIITFGVNPNDVIRLEREKDDLLEKINELEEDKKDLTSLFHYGKNLLYTMLTKYIEILDATTDVVVPIEEYSLLCEALDNENYGPLARYWGKTGQIKVFEKPVMKQDSNQNDSIDYESFDDGFLNFDNPDDDIDDL